ncbi:hypothetical protein OC846_001704 [Tilletia horrida]|uniref:Dickkopf N-terminal cysteine-rich domain-containing protein n=1 Tax=Tilletia horrida TaxID=155126 RepID=A0AAN6GVH1_9BASI|nr:hypothetical protein OC846_001704 [Tilletia horrida]KAK0567397.1 hypothetical protein OC861_002718 [Tilletia horrida]
MLSMHYHRDVTLALTTALLGFLMASTSVLSTPVGSGASGEGLTTAYEPCKSSSECYSNLCQANVCQPVPLGATCRDDRDCEYLQQCSYGYTCAEPYYDGGY